MALTRAMNEKRPSVGCTPNPNASARADDGFKLFYDEDVNIFGPAETLALSPVRDLVTYQ